MRRILALLLFAAAVPVWAAQPVRARHGMVVSRERHATEVGLKVLEAGGNAIDAAVAVGFALAVTHPSAGNIGGGGFMLVRLADGRTTFIDFRERAPEAASRNMYLDAAGRATEDSTVGYRASGVPGTVRGLEYASQKYGKKPWAVLVEPAAQLASNGFALSYAQAQESAQSVADPARGLNQFPESKRIFLRDGSYYEPGEVRWSRRTSAHTLDRIAETCSAPSDFYEGEIRSSEAGKGYEGAWRPDHLGRSEAIRRHRTEADDWHLSRLHYRHVAAAEFGRGGNPRDAGSARRYGL